MHFTPTGHGSELKSRAQKPAAIDGSGPALHILKALAVESQAKAVAFRPSRAGTPLFADGAAHSIWTFVAILADFVSITHMVHNLSPFFDPTVRKVLMAIYECLEPSTDES